MAVQTRKFDDRPQLVASVGYSENGAKKPCDFCLFSGAEPAQVGLTPERSPRRARVQGPLIVCHDAGSDARARWFSTWLLSGSRLTHVLQSDGVLWQQTVAACSRRRWFAVSLPVHAVNLMPERRIVIGDADTARVLQGLQHFEPYQHSGHIFHKAPREECVLGGLRNYQKLRFQEVNSLSDSACYSASGRGQGSSGDAE